MTDIYDHTPSRQGVGFAAKWFFLFVGAVAAIGLVGWAMDWFSTPGQVFSAANVREQWAFAYRYDSSLDAAARQVCSAERAHAEATNDAERIQRRSQLAAFEQNYYRIQAEYDGRLRNAFEARLVKPSDVPDRAPELVATKRRVCSPQ